MKLKIPKERLTSLLYLICLFLWCVFFSLSNDTTIGQDLSGAFYTINNVVWIMVQVILIFKILMQKKKKELVISFLILLIGYISNYYSESNFLSAFFIFLAASKNVEEREIVKVMFWANLLVIIITLSLNMTGIISSVIAERSGGILRNSLGFSHPNSLAQKVFNTSLMYLYLKDRKLNFYHLGLVMVIAYAINQVTHSQTAWYMTISAVMLLCVYILNIKKKNMLSKISKKVLSVISCLSAVVAIFSLCTSVFYKENPIINSIDSTSSLASRFAQMYLYYCKYPINAFGRALYYSGGGNNLGKGDFSGLYTLDNSYMYLLLGFGIIVFAFFIYLYFKTIYFSAKDKNYLILIILVEFAVYGFAETILIRFSYNFALIFLFATVWRNTNIRQNKRLQKM